MVALLSVSGMTVLLCPNARSTTSIQAIICRPFVEPTITLPASGTTTTDDSVVVRGTGDAGMTATISRSTVEVGAATIMHDGTYMVDVPLAEGDNQLMAREVDACGTTQDSTVVHIRRDTNGPGAGSGNTSLGTGIDQSEPLPPVQLPAVGGPIVPTPDTPGFGKPTILHPTANEVVHSSRLWVSGTAPPGSVVTISVNGTDVAEVVASDTGEYGAMVNIDVGSDTVQARATQGQQAATSDPVTVTFARPEDAAASSAARRGEPSRPSLWMAVLTAIAGVVLTLIAKRRRRRDR